MKQLERVLGVVAAIALFGMMAITFADVIGRKLVGTSITGSVEITELLMLVLIFVAIPLTSLHGEHIVFDLLDPLLPRGVKTLQHRLANLVCTSVLIGAAWLVWGRAQRSAEYGDTTAQLGIGLANFYFLTAALLVLCAVMHLTLAVRASPDSDQFHLLAAESKDD
jgi:TRAP-type C4-dicarboxylate transport system permease small subunit